MLLPLHKALIRNLLTAHKNRNQILLGVIRCSSFYSSAFDVSHTLVHTDFCRHCVNTALQENKTFILLSCLQTYSAPEFPLVVCFLKDIFILLYYLIWAFSPVESNALLLYFCKNYISLLDFYSNQILKCPRLQIHKEIKSNINSDKSILKPLKRDGWV